MSAPDERKAFQDYYPESTKHCYGCGARNPDGYRIRSFADGDEAVCRFTPEPFHTAVPGAVYGGLIASLIDCHGTGTAAWEAYRAAGRPMDSDPPLRFVTGSLHVDYRKPTPLGVELVLRARATEITDRKVRVRVRLEANGVVTAEGEVVAVRIPEAWLESLAAGGARAAEVLPVGEGAAGQRLLNVRRCYSTLALPATERGAATVAAPPCPKC